MLAFRRAHPVLRREAFYTDKEVTWFDASGKKPAWSDPRQKCLACLIHTGLFLIFNAQDEAVAFAVPPAPSGSWRLAVDTFNTPGEESSLANQVSFPVQPRSSVILVSDAGITEP
jgi:glycogen operon protein